MKVSVFSLFDRIIYSIFSVIIIITLYFNASILNFYQFRSNVFLYANLLNPMQYLANTCKGVVEYITDFAMFRKQMLEFENLRLELTNILNKENIAQQDAKLLDEALQTYKNEYITRKSIIVKLLYSTESNVIKDTFFETPSNIVKVNSILLNNNCILGRVYKQDGKYSHVLLYTDSQFRLPVYTEKSRIFGMIYGGSNLHFSSFTNSDDEKIQEGEKVIIASSDGIFAEGIPFGTISPSDGNHHGVKTECLRYYKYALAF